MIPLFDAHCDTLHRCAASPGSGFTGGGQWDLAKMGRFCPKGQFFAIWWDSARENDGFAAQYAVFQRECRRHSGAVSFCRTGAEGQAAARAGKLAAYLSVEGGELLECSLARLEEAWRLGVRCVNLTWNHANALSGSHCDRPEQGLTSLGRAFVRRMGELGMLIDVSHLSDAGFWDVMEATDRPVVATHSNSRSVFFHTRNLTDRQFTAIMDHNGAVGLNAYAAFLGPDPVTQDRLIAHLEHFLALGGEKTVALGGDWDGCDRLPAGCDGVWDWEKLYEALLRRNNKEDLVRDLFYNNLMRVVNEVCIM